MPRRVPGICVTCDRQGPGRRLYVRLVQTWVALEEIVLCSACGHALRLSRLSESELEELAIKAAYREDRRRYANKMSARREAAARRETAARKKADAERAELVGYTGGEPVPPAVPPAWCEACGARLRPGEVLTGTCPRCGEPITHVLVDPATAAEIRKSSGGEP